MSPRQVETAKEWFRRAKSNLLRAAQAKPEGVYWEDLCYDAQQAAEKAIKALFIFHGKKFPFTHDIGQLIEDLESFIDPIPLPVRASIELTDYAVATRYPGWGGAVMENEYKKALNQAQVLLAWIEPQLGL